MNFPSDCRYTKEHEWVKVQNGIATIGITEFAQQELGDIVFVELPANGRKVKQGETFCVVESTKAASDVYSPISGSVKEVNKELSAHPEKLNKDSYNTGWMVKLDGISESELKTLMTAEQYKAHLGDKI